MSRGYVLTYDGSLSSTAVPELVVQTRVTELVPSIRDTYVEVPGREGAWLFPGKAGDRTLTMQVRLIATDSDARRAAVRALARYVNKDTKRRLIIDNEPDRFWMAKLANPSAVTELVNHAQTELVWRTDPYAEAINTTSQTATGSTAPNNTGDTDLYPIIEVTALENSADGFALTVGGVVLDYGGNVNNGEIKTVSCRSATVTTGANADYEFATDTFLGGALDMASVSGDFGTLAPGVGSVSIARMTARLRVVWRPRYG